MRSADRSFSFDLKDLIGCSRGDGKIYRQTRRQLILHSAVKPYLGNDISRLPKNKRREKTFYPLPKVGLHGIELRTDEARLINKVCGGESTPDSMDWPA